MLFWLGLVLSPNGAEGQSDRRPNIIYIYADDLGIGELGCYGQTQIRTPYLDRMAAEGLRFTRHYAGAPVCAPSRCMLLTGRHAGHAAIRANFERGGFSDEEERGQQPLPDSVLTVAELLRSRGYRTALFGKWGLGVVSSGGSPLRHGFEEYYGYLDQKQAHNLYPTHLWDNDKWDTLANPWVYVHSPIDSTTAREEDFQRFVGTDYAPDRITRKALAFLSRQDTTPFFLYLPYPLPHLSLQVPERYAKEYLGQFPESPYYGQQGYAACKYPLSTYAAMITFLDTQVGNILAALQEKGLDEHTVVIFSSDNGATNHSAVGARFFASNGLFWGFKGDLYEGGIRVPMLVRWPGHIAPGQVTDHLSSQSDMMATLAELTGSPLTSTDGISLVPVWRGRPDNQAQHDWLYWEFSEYGGQIAVQWQGWKGIRRNLKNDPHAAWQLYYLPDDEGETTDLAGLRPDILKQLDDIVRQAHQCPSLREWEVVQH